MIEDDYTYTIPFEDMLVCEDNERRHYNGRESN